MSILKYYFQVNALRREINIYCNKGCDNKNNYEFLADEYKCTYSFDDILKCFEDISSTNYKESLENLNIKMIKYVALDKKKNEEILNDIDNLNVQFKDNIIAVICLQIIKNRYLQQRNALLHLNPSKLIIDAITNKYIQLAKKQIRAINQEFEEIFSGLINNLLCHFKDTPHNILETNAGYILKTDNKKVELYFSLNKSIKPFLHIFFSEIINARLNIYECKHCHNHFFEKHNIGYCRSAECQDAKEREIRKSERARRKNDVYVNTVDAFSNYTRQLKHKLKLQKPDEQILNEFEKEKKKCLKEIKEQVYYYRELNMKIDPKLELLISEKKQFLKNLSNKTTQ